MPDLTQVLSDLRSTPLRVSGARSMLDSHEFRDKPGIYTWWCLHGQLPHLPTNPHPRDSKFDVLYVGISPKDAKSSGTLRKRIVNNHLGGNTSSSTFRYAMAALLREELKFQPIKKGKKYSLPAEENDRLSDWQAENLAVTWSVCESPWTIEADVIEELRPPLNAAKNEAHPFYVRIRSARQQFRAAAKAGPTG
jgi:hypothetical protein